MLSRFQPMGLFWMAVVVVFLASCSVDPHPKASDPQRGDVVTVETVSAIGVTGTSGLYTQLASLATLPIADESLKTIVDGVLPTVTSSLSPKALKSSVLEQLKVTYYTADAGGRVVQASGLVILPHGTPGQTLSLPVLSLQHGTQIYRPYSPSDFTLKLLATDPKSAFLSYPESILGLLFAGTGYIVAIPDYPGLGVSSESHPYVHLSVANSVVDLLKALPAILQSRSAFGTSWDRSLYLTGYSEGGYATLAAARAIQAANDAGDNSLVVTAAAPLSGPHDLSGTMRDLMVSQPSKAPFFLPYMLAGYRAIYQTPEWLPSSTLAPPYDTTLPPLLDGTHTSAEVTAAMPVRAGTSDRYPVDVLLPAFVQELKKPVTGDPAVDGPILSALVANDSYRGWVPRMRLRFYHCSTDDMVPWENTDRASKAWGTLSNLDPVQEVVPLAIPGAAVHVQAALPAYLAGFLWIYGLGHGT